MIHISYWNIEGTDLYAVRCAGQTAVFSRHVLVKKIGLDPRVIVGCKEVPMCEIIDLGFMLSAVEIGRAKRVL